MWVLADFFFRSYLPFCDPVGVLTSWKRPQSAFHVVDILLPEEGKIINRRNGLSISSCYHSKLSLTRWVRWFYGGSSGDQQITKPLQVAPPCNVCTT